MPKTKAVTLKRPIISRPQEESSFRIGAPPVSGKPVILGRYVAVGGTDVVGGPDVGGTDVGGPDVGGTDVGGTDVVVPVGVAVAVGGTDVVVPVGVAVAVGGTDVVVAVGVAVACVTQIGPVIVLESNVTSPVCTKARPSKFAPVCRWMDSRARILPMKAVPVPRVPDEPSRHHTLHGSPPITAELDDVVSVDADLKIQTPSPLSTRFPDSKKASAQ